MNFKSGFTLVELMISMSIIAILSVVLSVSFSRAQRDGRDQRRVEDLKAVQSAAEQYFLLTGNYPTSAGSWSVGTQTILQKFPTGPKKENYIYYYNSTSNGFCVCATGMESGKYGNAGSTGVFPCDFQTSNPPPTNYCVSSQQ